MLGIRGAAVGPTALRVWFATGIDWKPEDVEKCLEQAILLTKAPPKKAKRLGSKKIRPRT